MFFTEKNRKKNLIVFFLVLPFFCGAVFLAQTHVVYAGMFSGLGDSVGLVFKGLFYSIFKLFGLLASVAVGIFEWAINPNNVALLFNRPSIYETWKFIRDFFNLLFILVLLYTAFKIIFQIEQNFKKTLLSIVLAALYINFSYPVTRVLIDVTNVPMYFFANQMMASDGKTTMFSSTMTASKLEKILLPKDLIDTDFTNIIAAIVFIFIFSITLLVLSIMFMIRLIVLVVLVIFSSVGFAASIAPGLEQYSKQWWENFWRYAFFGPIAMLMLVVATRFFASISDNNSDLALSMKATAGTTAAGNGAAEYLAPMMMFSIPIIMLWIAMGLAQKMSIAGAGSVVGMGQKFSTWAGKKTLNGGKWLAYKNPIVRGVGGGVKDRFEGTRVGRWIKSPSSTEAAVKGWTKKTGVNPLGSKGREGARSELQKLKDKQINEQVKKNKEDSLSRSAALKGLESTDEIKRVANAISLAQMDNGIQNMDDLSKALNALKDPKTGAMNESYREKAVEIVSKADKKIIATTPATATTPAQSGLQNLNTVIGAIGKNQKAINDLIDKLDDSAFSGSAADYGAVRNAAIAVNPKLEGALESKIRKEGEAKILVDYHIAGGATPSAAVDGVLGSMRSVKDLVASKSLFMNYQAEAVNYVNAQPAARYQEIKKAAAQDSPSVSAMI